MKSYSRERMTNIGAVVCMIQAVLYLSFVIYFLEIFLNDSKLPLDKDRRVLRHLTQTVHTLFLSILFFAGFIHVAWIGSSAYLLLHNRNGNEKSVSQFVAMTSLVCLMDIIFPFIVLPTQYTVFAEVTRSSTIDFDTAEEPIKLEQTDYGQYFWLLMTFIRGGCFTFAIDAFIVVVAYQRFMLLHELRVKVKATTNVGPKGLPMYPINDDLDKNGSETPTFQVERGSLQDSPTPNKEHVTTYVPERTPESEGRDQDVEAQENKE